MPMTHDNASGAHLTSSVYRTEPAVNHGSFAEAEKTRHIIKALKYILPVIAFFLVGVFLYLSGVFGPVHKIETDKYLAEIDNIQLKKDSAQLNNLKLVVRNNNDGNYELTAATATRKNNEPGRYFLERVDAIMKKRNGGWAKIRGNKGIYDKKTDILKLRDRVEIRSDKGYVARMAAARVNVNLGHLVSEAPVDVDLPNGNVKAGFMEVLDRGRIIRFRERPKMVLNMSNGGAKQ